MSLHVFSDFTCNVDNGKILNSGQSENNFKFSLGTILPHNTLRIPLRHQRMDLKKYILGQNIKTIVNQCLSYISDNIFKTISTFCEGAFRDI